MDIFAIPGMFIALISALVHFVLALVWFTVVVVTGTIALTYFLLPDFYERWVRPLVDAGFDYALTRHHNRRYNRRNLR